MFRSIRHFSSSSLRRDLARMTLVGRIGAKIEISTSQAGREYVRYPLAVETRRKRDTSGGEVIPATTSWFQVNVFDERAINFMVNNLGKGSTVYVEAEASISTYENEGQINSSLTLVQRNINPLVWKKPVIDSEETQGTQGSSSL